ncbi:hypothetical protein ARSEF1564_002478 [Beauveria bassiana]
MPTASYQSLSRPAPMAAETGNAALVRILLEAGAKVNSTCWMGISVLGYAMEANNIKTVHLLFSQLGIDLDYWCRHQEPVLLTAVARDKLDLAEVLLPLVDPNQIGQEGITPLRLAVREEKASVIAELLHDDWRTDVEFSSRIDQTPARMAFYHAEVSNMDFPIHFKKRKTARHILFYLACGGGNFGLAEEILELATHDDEEFLKRLQRLPLELLQMVASHLDDTASISRLCRSGRHLYNDLEEYLYRYDAVLVSSEKRCKALRATVAKSTLDTATRVSIAQKSLEAGADVNFCVKVYYRFSRSLIPQHYRLEYNDRGSILSAAVACGCFPLVKVLVHFKADINRRTEEYEAAPIAIAVLESGSGILRFLLRQPTLDLSASRTGYFGHGSALHLAVLLNQLNYVKRLVPYADSQVDNGPWNPLLWSAVLQDNSAMVSFLLSCEKFDVNALRRDWNNRFWSFGKPEHTVFAYTCGLGSLEMVKLLHDNSRVDVDLCGKLNPNAPDELNGIVDPAWLYTFHEKYQVDELSELNELNELNELEYPPARFAMMYYGHGETADFLINSSKCKTARDYIFRAACARERIELAHKVVRLAEDRDKKHAKRWIEQAELYNLHSVARSIREKWGDV